MQTFTESIPSGYILAKDTQPGCRYGIPSDEMGVAMMARKYYSVIIDSEASPCDCPGRFFSDIIHVKVRGEEEPRHLTEGMLLRVE